MNSYRFFISFILIFLCEKSFAQNDLGPKYGIQANIHYGFVMRHHNYIGHLVQGHVKAGELNFFQQRYGQKIWEQLYKYPQTGITLSYFDLGNTRQLGNLYGLYPYINFPFKKTDSFSLNLKVGTGVSYVSKRFNAIENHKNIAIGSAFNALINLRLNTQLKLSKYFLLETGLGVVHFSNGAFKMPNLGLNIITVNAGVVILSPVAKYAVDSILPIQKKVEYNIEGSTGVCEIQPVGGRKYFAYVLSANRLKRVTNKSKLGFGLDVFYNEANIPIMEEDSVALKNNIQNVQPGVKFCYELIMEKLSIPIEMGAYAYTKLKSNGPIYNQFGLKYMVSKSLSAGFILKTHFAKADFAMVRLGYKFD